MLLLASVTMLLSVIPRLEAQQNETAQSKRTAHFLSQRQAPDHVTHAEALARARAQQAKMLFQPRATSLSVAWQPLGPSSIVSPTYGNLSGRLTAIALDPNDATGNTVYLGTTGGGVWKSANAAGPLASVTFAPLTDTLPVFAANSGSAVLPSLSIGAVAVQPAPNPVILAGTGDPNDATDSLYGTGLLRSADGGLTWTLVQSSNDGTTGHHLFNGLATAGLAFSTATPALVVAAFSVSPESAAVAATTDDDSVPGLYYSTDAGVTWQMSLIYDGTTLVQGPALLGTAQAANPATAVVWDALRGHFFAAIHAHGYYSSVDGVTWTRLAAQPGTGLTTANCPAGTNGGGSANCPIFRGALAVQPATGDLYALTVDANNLDQGLWQDLCNANGGSCANSAPTFSTRLDQGVLEAGSGSTAIAQGTYNLALAAAPTAGNSTLLFAGTTDLYRCTLATGATSCALRNATNAVNGCATLAGVAPAQHALATMAQARGVPLLFAGNDGGLWRSLDGVAVTGSACAASDASHFDNLNAAIGSGGSLAEVTGFAQHPTDVNTVLAGLGANGSAATSAASSLAAWPQLSAGEGGAPLLDPATPNNWTLAIGVGVDLKQCTLGSSCSAANFASPATIGETQVANDAALLDPPALLDPAQTTNMLIGTCRVWRGPAGSGASWSLSNALSPAFNGSATPCTGTSPLIRSLAAGGPAVSSTNVQSSGSTVIYTGLAGTLDGGGPLGGHLFMTRSANTASFATPWTDVAKSPVTNDASSFNSAGADITSIAVDTHDATGATVYAAIAGFGSLTSTSHLYRSTDFGQHWLDITANLPNAPANAVIVDPNDANTLYMAMDTGIYATTAIATCASTNCWSPLGTGLPNSPVVALAAAAGVATGDGRRGMLRAATYGRGLWQQPLLTAVGAVQPALTLSTSSFSFAAQQVATQSASQTLTLTSTGNAAVTISSLAVSGDFIESDTCSGQTLAINAACTVQIQIAPASTGARTGQLTIYANVSGGQAMVALSGTGTAAASIVLTPLTLAFAATTVSQSTATKIVTVSNMGGTSATLQTPVVTGDFSLSANTCGATLGASASCSLAITFTPTASGSRTGTLTLIDSVGTQTAELTGTGTAPATDTLSTSALIFSQQQITTGSAAQQIVLTNAGDAALTLLNAVISGSDFAVVNGCGNSLIGHASCAISVSFVPTAIGTRTAMLTLTDEFRSQAVSLTGTGVAPPGVSLTPLSLAFPATGNGLTSVPQTFTLTNNGGTLLTLSSPQVTKGFAISATTCSATVAVNSACSIQVVFAPSAAGLFAGALTLTDNAPSGTQIATLSGTGIDFTLAASVATTITIASGTSAAYPLLLTSPSGVMGNVALSCSGAPAHSTCIVTPSTSTLGSTVSIVATVQTGLAIAQLTPPTIFGEGLMPTLAFLPFALPLFLVRRRTRSKFILQATVLAFIASSLTACGTPRTIPASTLPTAVATPTPSGTYTLTVSATAAGLTHSVPLTLIVQ